jgi:hypothetical protein
MDLPADLADRTELPVVDPDELADQYWDVYTRRDGVERSTHRAARRASDGRRPW